MVEDVEFEVYETLPLNSETEDLLTIDAPPTTTVVDAVGPGQQRRARSGEGEAVEGTWTHDPEALRAGFTETRGACRALLFSFGREVCYVRAASQRSNERAVGSSRNVSGLRPTRVLSRCSKSAVDRRPTLTRTSSVSRTGRAG
jgi:hypothetical protein